MWARQDPRWSWSEPNAPLHPAVTRGAARALGRWHPDLHCCGQGAEPRGDPAAGASRARRRGAVTGRSVGPQPVACGASARAGSGAAFGSEFERAHPGSSGETPESRLRVSTGAGQGWVRGRHCPWSRPAPGALDAGPGVSRAAPSHVTAIANPKALLASLRQWCQGHRDWMSARFCPRLDRLKPLDKRIIDGTSRLYRDSARPSYGPARSGPRI